ncbi:hypothetical protein LSAT2_018495 [Lamellibrachia satsuma]|nr:hypothetical protein LSAT2_018495 [Lamellibrachia satsuma]
MAIVLCGRDECTNVSQQVRRVRQAKLWVVPRNRDDPPAPQQFGYVNIVPTRSAHGVFDSFGETIRKFNSHLRKHPLPGRVMNVESQEMKFHEWGVGVDPDESCWVESVKFNVSFLVVIRVFFETGTSAYEEIGCADFVPTCRDVGSQFATSDFEDFGSVVYKARCWIRQQQDVRVTNIQSIDYKLLHGSNINDVDTQRSFYVESGLHTTRYLRVLRICFVKPFDGSPLMQDEPFRLNYVTFEPLMISSGGIIGIPLFQTMDETMKRAVAWLNQSPPELEAVSAETVPVRMFSGNQYGNHEVTYTWNRGEQKEFWLLVLRIFVNGDYDVSPGDLLPEVDDKDKDNNCACVLL